MFYIFNSENKCIGFCDYEPNKEDLETRGEFSVESDEQHKINSSYTDGVISNPTIVINYEEKARELRNILRNNIDKFLLPASTIDDILVIDEQKQLLIQDSLLLAKWPSVEGWPYIGLPVLSDLCQSLITIPVWSYPEQTNIIEE
jgi:hypothetical protein